MSDTVTGETGEGQLFGGPQDGRDVLVPLMNGRPPASLVRPSGRYLADGVLAEHTPAGAVVRYTLEGHPRPFAREKGGPR